MRVQSVCHAACPMSASSPAEALATAPPARLRGPVEAVARLAGPLALAVAVLAGLAAAAGAAAGTRFLSGSPTAFPGWVAGPLAGLGAPPLGPEAFVALLAAMGAAYAVALVAHHRLSLGAVLCAVAAAHLVWALAPPIVTPDVFSYIAYARLGATHGLSPYVSPPAAVPGDPVLAFVSFRDLRNPYGPLFTLATYPLAGLGLPAALWTLKAVTAAASLGCVALVAFAARARGGSPVLAAVFVGLNPLLLVYGVGGAHNDSITMLLVLAGVLLAGAGREVTAAGAVVAGAAVKVTGGLVLPFLVAGARGRPGALRRALLGTIAAGTLVLAVWVLVFGADALVGFARTLAAQGRMVSELSLPYLTGWLIGEGGAGPIARLGGAVLFLAAAAWLLVRVARGHDWVDAAGWGTLALLLSTAWLMPYYVVWLLPLAALGSRCLAGATLALCLLVGVSRAALLLL